MAAGAHWLLPAELGASMHFCINFQCLDLFLVELGGVAWAEAVTTNSCWHDVRTFSQVN